MSRTRTLIAVALMSCLATLAGARSGDQFEVVFPANEVTDPSTLDVVRTGERTIESEVRPGTTLRVVDLEFTSFDWAGETWRHEARLVLPAAGVPERAREAGVVVAGIRPYADAAAAILGVPALLVVSGNPGPRYGEPREGELMGVSLARQAETGDPRWNGYAWLGKVLVRGVTVMAHLPETRTTRSVVTGCSKRGMAAWIAAAADDRVVGAFPTCWNTGNYRATAKLLVDRLGGDYRRGGAETKAPAFVSAREQYERTLDPRFERLAGLTDPVLYGDRIASKRILYAFGTNDPLYHVLSCNLVLPELAGEKRALLVPNTEHTPDTPQHVAAWTMWVAHCLLGRDVPRIAVTHAGDEDRIEVLATVDADTSIRDVELWWAHDPAGRYNDSTWSSTVMVPTSGRFRAIIERPGGSSTVLFVAVQDSDPATCDGYVTSSPIEIAPTG